MVGPPVIGRVPRRRPHPDLPGGAAAPPGDGGGAVAVLLGDRGEDVTGVRYRTGRGQRRRRHRGEDGVLLLPPGEQQVRGLTESGDEHDRRVHPGRYQADGEQLAQQHRPHLQGLSAQAPRSPEAVNQARLFATNITFLLVAAPSCGPDEPGAHSEDRHEGDGRQYPGETGPDDADVGDLVHGGIMPRGTRLPATRQEPPGHPVLSGGPPPTRRDRTGA